MNSGVGRIGLLLVILVCIGAFFALDLQQYLGIDFFVEQRQVIDSFTSQHFALASALYFLVYMLVFALALPVGAILTLIGGAIFGLWWGVLLVSFASTLGSTLAFLASRFLLGSWVHGKFGDKLRAIDEGVKKEGAFYLFTLRLVPLFPPALINLAMGLTPIRTVTFYWVSQLGMLAGTFVYVNAGTELGKLGVAGDSVLSPGLVSAFVLLGIFPLLAKKVLDWLKRRRVYTPYTRPGHFDYNLVVIGAGSGGLVSAYIAATVNARVALVEKDKMGGDCLNTGCVPSKTLIRSARIAHYVARAGEYGIQASSSGTDFTAVMDRVRRAIKAIEPHDSVERYTGLGVDCLQGEARITSPFTVEVNGKSIATRNIIIASGGRPAIPEVPGIDTVSCFTSDTIWELQTLPEHLLVLGAGPIACELAQAFRRLGSRVTMVVRSNRFLPREDVDASEEVLRQFSAEGIDVLFERKLVAFGNSSQQYTLAVEHAGEQQVIDFTQLLVATGRQANTENMGLESLPIELSPDGTVEVDDYMRTSIPNIYAVGDVAGPYQFTHVASHQAWYAAVNALFGSIWKFRADYSVIPWATFTDPEVARVGLNERDAMAAGIDYEVTKYPLEDLDRAIADGEASGFVKVLTPPGKDTILGATIVGYHASELLNEFIATMKRRGRLGDILGTIHIYPTLGEANKFAAGEWRKAHKPQSALAFAGRFHQWMRG